MKSKFNYSLIALLLGASVAFGDGESKYATGTTNANIVIGPAVGQKAITALSAKSDLSTATLDLYAKGGAGKKAITVAPTSGTFTVSIDNPSHGISTNDVAVYVYADGTLHSSRVTSSATNSVTLARALPQAGTTGDRIYEVTKQFVWSIGTTALNIGGYDLFYTPSDSPVYGEVLGNTAEVVNATARGL